MRLAAWVPRVGRTRRYVVRPVRAVPSRLPAGGRHRITIAATMTLRAGKIVAAVADRAGVRHFAHKRIAR